MIKHYALRLILWLNGYTPFKFINFLDHCARLILLKKVGGGYIFIHRMLLEYFAELTPQSTRTQDSVKNGVRARLASISNTTQATESGLFSITVYLENS